jgi:putative ABC transport system permease protein
LIGSGLMVKSLVRLLAVDPGFTADNLLTFRLSLPEAPYPNNARTIAFYDQLMHRMEALPGVSGAARVGVAPLIGGNTIRYAVDGQPAPRAGEEPEANIRDVSANYFDVMGVPLIKGRRFGERDTESAPGVLIINQTLAHRAFGDGDPIGKRLGFASLSEQTFEIVGLVRDEKVTGLDTRTTPVIYYPYTQDPDRTTSLMVRTTIDPNAVLGSIKDEVRALDPTLPLYGVQTMKELIANSPATFLRRYPTTLIGIFAGVALMLAAIGIYGVTSFSVSRRTHELGVRIALGAGRGDILGLVVRQGMAPVGIGLAVGLAGAFGLTRLLSSMLFEVSPTDIFVFGSVTAVLALIALIGCLLPGRRATRVDPMTALRYE